MVWKPMSKQLPLETLLFLVQSECYIRFGVIRNNVRFLNFAYYQVVNNDGYVFYVRRTVDQNRHVLLILPRRVMSACLSSSSLARNRSQACCATLIVSTVVLRRDYLMNVFQRYTENPFSAHFFFVHKKQQSNRQVNRRAELRVSICDAHIFVKLIMAAVHRLCISRCRRTGIHTVCAHRQTNNFFSYTLPGDLNYTPCPLSLV